MIKYDTCNLTESRGYDKRIVGEASNVPKVRFLKNFVISMPINRKG